MQDARKLHADQCGITDELKKKLDDVRSILPFMETRMRVIDEDRCEKTSLAHAKMTVGHVYQRLRESIGLPTFPEPKELKRILEGKEKQKQ